MGLFGLTKIGKLRAFFRSPVRQTRRSLRDFVAIHDSKFKAALARNAGKNKERLDRIKRMGPRELAAEFSQLKREMRQPLGGLSARGTKAIGLSVRGQNRRMSRVGSAFTLAATGALVGVARRNLRKAKLRKASRRNNRSTKR